MSPGKLAEFRQLRSYRCRSSSSRDGTVYRKVYGLVPTRTADIHQVHAANRPGGVGKTPPRFMTGATWTERINEVAPGPRSERRVPCRLALSGIGNHTQSDGDRTLTEQPRRISNPARKQAVPDLCHAWHSLASMGSRPCQRIRISPSCGGRAKRRSTSPAWHPETMPRASATTATRDHRRPQPAGTVRADAEVQTQVGCEGSTRCGLHCGISARPSLRASAPASLRTSLAYRIRLRRLYLMELRSTRKPR